jgi:hypothetical protein
LAVVAALMMPYRHLGLVTGGNERRRRRSDELRLDLRGRVEDKAPVAHLASRYDDGWGSDEPWKPTHVRRDPVSALRGGEVEPTTPTER